MAPFSLPCQVLNHTVCGRNGPFLPTLPGEQWLCVWAWWPLSPCLARGTVTVCVGMMAPFSLPCQGNSDCMCGHDGPLIPAWPCAPHAVCGCDRTWAWSPLSPYLARLSTFLSKSSPTEATRRRLISALTCSWISSCDLSISISFSAFSSFSAMLRPSTACASKAASGTGMSAQTREHRVQTSLIWNGMRPRVLVQNQCTREFITIGNSGLCCCACMMSFEH